MRHTSQFFNFILFSSYFSDLCSCQTPFHFILFLFKIDSGLISDAFILKILAVAVLYRRVVTVKAIIRVQSKKVAGGTALSLVQEYLSNAELQATCTSLAG